MTVPNKTPAQLAAEHWASVEVILLQSMRMQMALYKDAFIEGYNHGKEDRHVRTRPTTKRGRMDNTTERLDRAEIPVLPS